MNDSTGASKQKPYVYVDETGSDTDGKLSIVAAVILDAEMISTATFACEAAERLSGKGKAKWKVSRKELRLEYIRIVCESPELRGKLYYSVFSDVKDYESTTLQGIAYMLASAMNDAPYSAYILIDALHKNKKRGYSSRLHRLGVRTEKVVGIAREENSPLMRLADAVTGFSRDVTEGRKADTLQLYKRVMINGAIIRCGQEK